MTNFTTFFKNQFSVKRFGQKAFFWFLQDLSRNCLKGKDIKQSETAALEYVSRLNMSKEERDDFESLLSEFKRKNHEIKVDFFFEGNNKTATVRFSTDSTFFEIA
jgi:patatin-like phospholipase/acyl hydrolase